MPGVLPTSTISEGQIYLGGPLGGISSPVHPREHEFFIWATCVKLYTMMLNWFLFYFKFKHFLKKIKCLWQRLLKIFNKMHACDWNSKAYDLKQKVCDLRLKAYVWNERCWSKIQTLFIKDQQLLQRIWIFWLKKTILTEI